MAKKSKKHDDDDDLIAGAEGGEGAGEPVVPPPTQRAHGGNLELSAWPVDPDHRSARDFLLGKGARDASGIVLDDEGQRGGGKAINFVLLLLLVGVGVGGGWQLWKVGSPQALAAKKAERIAMEQAFLEEQMAKQKKYGVLRIESNPPQAVVIKDGERIVTKKADTGEELVGKTPMNMMDLDIAQTYQIRVELEGHEVFEFAVAPHLWTKDSATGEYKFVKMIDLTPNVCEYWFLYDAKKRKEVQFPEKADCLTHFDDATQQGVSVTECTCKIPPEGWKPPEKKEDKKDEKKDAPKAP